MRVIWAEEALDQLSDFYVQLSLLEQDAVFKTVSLMNRQLAIKADQLGESREAWSRVWFEGQLMIRYEIFPDEDVVKVTEVVRLKPKKRG